MSEPSGELHLVLHAQCGEPAALETLLLRIQGGLSRSTSGLVGPSAADDVLEDVFLKIWQNLEWLHRPELFRPWAYRAGKRFGDSKPSPAAPPKK